jgi:signal transduction histidine kinase
MSGLETARLIKQRAKSRTIPIIFLTAIDKDAPHVFQGYSVGAVDYLFKPFDPQILRSKVSVFVELSLKSQQLERQAADLERAYRVLRENERYKDEFLSVISHELRTPINFIMGFSEILEDEVAGPLNAQQHEYLRKVLDGSERILMLVNDLIDVATMTAGKFEIHSAPTCYDDVVNEVISNLKPLAKQKSLSLQADLHAPHDVTIDGPRIAQALNNLVTNAIKFTPAGGAVTVSVHMQDHSLVTEVRDTGIGFCEEDIPKLFTSFRQLDMSTTRSVGGTGLGLNIAKALVEAHGGKLSAMSPGRNKGSVFTFTLPFASSPAEQPAESQTGKSD